MASLMAAAGTLVAGLFGIPATKAQRSVAGSGQGVPAEPALEDMFDRTASRRLADHRYSNKSLTPVNQLAVLPPRALPDAARHNFGAGYTRDPEYQRQYALSLNGMGKPTHRLLDGLWARNNGQFTSRKRMRVLS